MIKIENAEVFGWEAAIRGMRNPMNSWDKSDSEFGRYEWEKGYFKLGENDLKLMKSLIKAGKDHGKFSRYLMVQLDITAPFYWWKEFKTYRKGRKFMDDGDEFLDPEEFEFYIETNSCSTMHKIHAKEFTLDDFSHEHLLDDEINAMIDLDGCGAVIMIEGTSAYTMFVDTIAVLNSYREKFLETKDKCYWYNMIQLLPSSYNQTRTVQLNYQVLRSMYFARKNHKLDEWVEFCKWIESLPYAKELICSE